MENRLIELKSKIEALFEIYSEAWGDLDYCREVDGEERLIEDELRDLFSEYKDIVSVSCVEVMTTFESCGYDCGVISIAFTNPVTGLETYLEMWERK
jgi:hypothetical protein